MYDYEFQTTFYSDLSIADKFGKNAIIDTCNRVFAAWRDNTEYFTEFILCLNWKIWEHYENNNLEIAKIYDKMWKKYDNYVLDNWSKEQISYYLNVTD